MKRVVLLLSVPLLSVLLPLGAQDVALAGPTAVIPEEPPVRVEDRPGVLGSDTAIAAPSTLVRTGDDRLRLDEGFVAAPTVFPPRELQVRINEVVQLSLAGSQWIFTGGQRSELGPLQRESSAEATRFRLTPRVAGVYELDFQKQDPVTGGILTQHYRMIVSGEPNLTPHRGTRAPAPQQAEPRKMDTARRLIRMGRHHEALVLLRPSSSSGNKEVLRLLAEAAEGAAYFREGIEYWENLLDVEDPDLKPGVYAQAFRLVLRVKDPMKASVLWGRLFFEDTFPDFPLGEAQLLDLAELFLDNGSYNAAAEVLEVWRERYPDTRDPAKGIFLTARWEERPEGSLTEALRLYTLVSVEHRLSPYAEVSGKKAAELRRTYFRIR